jgi:SAM-dependent methyltransferase
LAAGPQVDSVDVPLNGESSLSRRLARLERERSEADKRYNDALTALDRAVTEPSALPAPPPPADASKLGALHGLWDTAPVAPPPTDRSIKGRLRTFVWRLIGPPLEAQKTFNATLVEHLARTATAQTGTESALTDLLALLQQQSEARVRFEAHLIQYLQTVTWYVDTKDRVAAGDAQVLNAGLSAIADDWMKRWESLQARETRLLQQVQQVMASLDDVRTTSALAQQTALSLKRDVEVAIAGAPIGHATDRATAQPSAPPDLDAFKYLSFENQFRGSPAEIRARLAEYLPRFEGRSNVLEIGCGRGEFLDLLREHGISGRGLDINEAMVKETRERGLDAIRADALEHLASLPDASLGGLFAAQVVEHLPPSYLERLIETACHKLRPGGVIVLETINPTCWLAFFESFVRDLSHVKPLHPETLQFMLRISGFRNVAIELRSPVPEAQRLARIDWSFAIDDSTVRESVEAIVDRLNTYVDTLNGRLFSFQDYAIIGEK